MRRGRERVVCKSESCLSEASDEAEETVVCNWRIYLYCLYEAPAEAEETVVRNWDISIVSMTHQLRLKKKLQLKSVISIKHELRPKKQLFETQECYLYETPAEAEEIVVWNSRWLSLWNTSWG